MPIQNSYPGGGSNVQPRVFNKGMSYNDKQGYDGVVDGSSVGGFVVNPATGAVEGRVSTQIIDSKFIRRALIDVKEDFVFSQFSNTTVQPKNSGKTIKRYIVNHIIDDKNINDQGIDANGVVIANGNLWASSKDPGVIDQHMPLLTEWGGRVNRVGVTRREIKSEIEDYGFFVEFTRDSLDFDTDSELYSHISREALYAANKIMDTLIQKDLISKAKPHIAGTAVSVDAMDATSELVYKTFVKFNQKLDAVKAPRKTKIVTGSRNIDTKVIPNARYLMYPSELQEQLESMQNFHGKEAFIGSEHYAAATTLANSELGKVGRFRMIQVDNMIDNTEKSLVAADPLFYADDAGNFKVFPLLFIASESFVSTTFHHTGGKKIDIIVQKPGPKTADRHDPYGKTGFYSVQFWYGILIEREEWLQKILCTAKS